MPGPQGKRGDKGPTGSIGPQGTPGVDGTTGNTGQQGQTGTTGSTGSNGYSLISVQRTATSLECGTSGGNASDVYLDLDRSGTHTLGDTWQTSVVACNGQAASNIIYRTPSSGYLSTSCVQISHTNFYTKKKTVSSTTVRVFESLSDCNSTQNYYELSPGGNELYFTGEGQAIILDGKTTDTLVFRTLILD